MGRRREGVASRATPGQRVVALAYGGASQVLCLLPRAVTLPVARAVGRATFHLLGRRRAVALENARAALGDSLEARDLRRLARESFASAAAMAVDLLTLPSVARSPRAVCEVSDESLVTLERAKGRGRGVILVAGHFGLFESMGILLGHVGHPTHFVAKPLGNPALDALINRARTATGNDFIHKGGAKARIRGILQEGGSVAIVVDQHAGLHDRLWIPFFGLPAATARSLGTLAVETGAAVVPIHSFPLARGRCCCEFGPLLTAAATGDPARAAEALVRRVITEMERAARRQPEAWLWLHRRWKVMPDGWTGPRPAYAHSESQERARAARTEAGRPMNAHPETGVVPAGTARRGAAHSRSGSPP